MNLEEMIEELRYLCRANRVGWSIEDWLAESTIYVVYVKIGSPEHTLVTAHAASVPVAVQTALDAFKACISKDGTS
jgi:hypothetical protein